MLLESVKNKQFKQDLMDGQKVNAIISQYQGQPGNYSKASIKRGTELNTKGIG